LIIQHFSGANPDFVRHSMSHPAVSVPAAQRSRIWLAELALLSVAVIWGVNIPVMKVALETGISPYALNAFRLIVSAIVLQGLAWHEFSGGVRPSGSLQRWRVFVYAIVLSAYQFLFLMSVSKTTSADIALIMATVPMWTALKARIFLKERISVIAWMGLLTAFSGTMIVTLCRQPASATAISSTVVYPERFLGNMLALLAALAWAGGTVFSRPLMKSISPTQLSACSATLGLPFHLLIAGATMSSGLPLLKQMPLQLCILYSGIFSTGLALSMWSFGVKHAGASQAAMFQNLSPVIAIVAAWLWRGEPLEFYQMIGGSMIIGGLIIMRSGRRPTV
jgi:drug/metabolite transporter (DMT)-like permease